MADEDEDPSELIQQANSCNAVKNFFMRLRPKKVKVLSPKKKKTKAEYQAEYRQRLKSHPDKWATYCKKQNVFVKQWRENLNPEEMEEQRKKTRVRCKAKRLKEKLAKEATHGDKDLPTPKGQERRTRAQVAVKELSTAKKRAYWKNKQQLRRANMTPEEKERIRERARQRYAQKKGHDKSHKEMQTDMVVFDDPVRQVNCSLDSTVGQSESCLDIAFLEDCSQYSTEINSANNFQDNPPQSPKTPVALDCSPSKPAKYCALYRTKKHLPQNLKTKVHILSKLLVECSSPEKAMVAEAVKKSAVKKSSKSLAHLFNSLDNFPSQSNGRKDTQPKKTRKRKDSVAKKTIVEFFLSEAVHLPGKKFYSKRFKKQKRVLTMPILSIFNIFRDKYPAIKVSKRTFFRCRPGYVLKMKSQKLIQCLCEICENAKLKLKALKLCGCKTKDLKEALSETLCPQTGGWWMPQCVARKCNDCGIHLLQEKLGTWCDANASVTFKEWRQVFHPKFKVNRTELVEDTVSIQNLINKFLAGISTLAIHSFTAEWQRAQFKNLKEHLPAHTALVIIDFAENYTCKYQREVASAHWSYNQITIHPVVMYDRCKSCCKTKTSYHVFISDDLNHDSNFVFHVLDHVMTQTSASNFVIFSDNCSSQYKSKLPFHHMSQLASRFKFERCYFGERHGKNECDSCGGMVKAFLSQAVASGRVVVRNAEEAVQYLHSHLALENVECSHNVRSFHLVKESQIDRSLSSSSLKTVPGTKKIHSFKVLSSEVLATRQFSCFCESCFKGMPGDCLNKNIIGAFTNVKWSNAMVHHKDRNLSKTAEDVVEALENTSQEVFNDDAETAVGCKKVMTAQIDVEIVEGSVGRNEELIAEINVEKVVEGFVETSVGCNELIADINVEKVVEGFVETSVGCNELIADINVEKVVEGFVETSVGCNELIADINVEKVVEGFVETSVGCNELIADINVEKVVEGFVETSVGCNELIADINVEKVVEGFVETSVGCNELIADNNVEKVVEDIEEETGTCSVEEIDSIEQGVFVSYPVRRALFGSDVGNRDLFFKSVYDKFAKCTSFLELHTLSRDLSSLFSSFEIEVDFKQSLQRRDVDTVAMQLLPKNTPHGYLPVITVGDGNCMPRSFSRIAFGHEGNHVEMRCRIISELCLNMSHYLDEDYVSLGCHLRKEKVLPLVTIMSECYSGEDVSNSAVIKAIFKKEILEARKLSCPLGVWQLMAASNVLRSNIISLYPARGPHRLQLLFGRGVMPHTNIPGDDRLAYIMWTSQRQMSQEHWVANHVVPLLRAHK